MTFFADFTSGQSNVSYTRMRQLLATSGGGLQEGVVGAGDLKVSQRAAGANMSVDVAVGDGWIQYDTGTRNGLSHIWSDAIANVLFNASDATNPRIDQVGIQLNDTSVGAGTGGNIPAPRYLPGTATAGATLDNRTGAAAAPNDWMRVADILVPAASTSVTTANIRDRRPWARGALFTTRRTAGALTTVSATYVQISTTLQARVECSGAPVRMRLSGGWAHTAAVAGFLQPTMDSAAWDGVTDYFRTLFTAGSGDIGFTAEYTSTPAAGSHVFEWFWKTGAATLTLDATTTTPAIFTVEEVVRQNAANT